MNCFLYNLQELLNYRMKNVKVCSEYVLVFSSSQSSEKYVHKRKKNYIYMCTLARNKNFDHDIACK